MVVLDQNGRSDYRAFRKSIMSRPGRLVFIAFDLLLFDSKDIRSETTLERRAALEWLLRKPPTTIQFSEAVTGGGKAFYPAVDELQLEGMVSKRASAPYVSGRTRSWVKTKCYTVSELEVASVLEERGSRQWR